VGWTPALPDLLYAMGLPGLNHPIGSGVVRGAPHEATAEQSRAQTYETALSPTPKGRGLRTGRKNGQRPSENGEKAGKHRP
jgi:hypothetical protein